MNEFKAKLIMSFKIPLFKENISSSTSHKKNPCLRDSKILGKIFLAYSF